MYLYTLKKKWELHIPAPINTYLIKVEKNNATLVSYIIGRKRKKKTKHTRSVG